MKRRERERKKEGFLRGDEKKGKRRKEKAFYEEMKRRERERKRKAF